MANYWFYPVKISKDEPKILVDDTIETYKVKIRKNRSIISGLRQRLNSFPQFNREGIKVKMEIYKDEVRMFEKFVKDLEKINTNNKK
jgi:hypothetical protein